MATEVGKVRAAFDNFLDALAENLHNRLDDFEEKMREKRLTTLESDLAELENRKNKE